MTQVATATQVAELKQLAIQVAELKTALADVQQLHLVAQLAVLKHQLAATTDVILVAKSSVLACWTCSSSARAKAAMKHAAMRLALADVAKLPQPLLLHQLLRKLPLCLQLQPLTTVHNCKASAASFRLAHTFASSNGQS